MAGNAAFLKLEATRSWLSQFEPKDQDAAADLLRAMRLVSRDAFADRLKDVLTRRLHAAATPVSIYVERELKENNQPCSPLFSQNVEKPRRASGPGPAYARLQATDVGSEGLVAQIVSELRREHPTQIFINPGPDKIRELRIRRFLLVTDFIGSGERATDFLNAAWGVYSVRSWWSARATKGLSFEVIAFAAATTGRDHVANHRCEPTVHLVLNCPTVNSAFSGKRRTQMIELCERYCPPSFKKKALGHNRTGALLAFAHGAPNNVPAILFAKSRDWLPLFPARITASTRFSFSIDDNDSTSIRQRLLAMRQTRLAASEFVSPSNSKRARIILLLAALSRPPRHVEAIASKTGLTIMEVEQLLAAALSHGWIDGQNHLSGAGRAELVGAKRPTKVSEDLSTQDESYYFPRSLRAPRA